jgi:hypothetical protein
VFAVAFKVLTSRPLGVRELAPGAAIASLAWFLLQFAGAWFFNSRVKGASNTYGTFALVIGLLSWFYLLAQITLLAAEVNVVRILRLWPRSFVAGDTTEADRIAVAEQLRAQLPRGFTPEVAAATLRSPSGSAASTSDPAGGADAARRGGGKQAGGRCGAHDPGGGRRGCVPGGAEHGLAP